MGAVSLAEISGCIWKCVEELGFESSKADPDVWFRPAKKRN
jgi:hypothetical protein